MWGSSREVGPGPLAAYAGSVHFVRPSREVALRLVSGRGHYEAVIPTVLGVERSVWIATANLKELMVEGLPAAAKRRRSWSRRAYRSVLDGLAEMAERGVELRILHAKLPSRAFRDHFDDRENLVAGGLELRMCARVHMKLVLVDGETAYLGSANWTGAGMGAKHADRRNFEIGMLTSDEGVIDDLQAAFDRVWQGRECAACRLRDKCDAPLDVSAGTRSR